MTPVDAFLAFVVGYAIGTVIGLIIVSRRPL